MSDPTVPVRDAYDDWARTYDHDANPTRDLDARVLRAAALQLAGARVIEFGAGTGKNTAHLAAGARSVLALDLSPAMLDRARARALGAHVRFAEHDITRPWPAADGAADIVVGNLVLEHIADLRPVFTEVRRVLRQGGSFYMCELHPYRQLRGSVARFARAGGETRVQAFVHTTAEYVMTALAAGFVLTEMAEPGDETSAPDAPEPAMPRLLALTFRAE